MTTIKLFSAGGIAALTLCACGPSGDLPPAPDIPPGQSWADQASGFSTTKMINLCDAANSVAAAGKLGTYSDAQIANGTCEMSVLAVQLIARDEPTTVCQTATVAMMQEFSRRFPGHKAEETIGRC
ncbi:MAG: hypothetical protein ACM3YN_01020 [Parcubacteria group bacterium]